MSKLLEQLKQNLSPEAYNKFALALSAEYLDRYSLEEVTEDCKLMSSLSHNNEYAIAITDGESNADNLCKLS
jgi:phosphopantetheinyl transferase (holo-ACP synthase)